MKGKSIKDTNKIPIENINPFMNDINENKDKNNNDYIEDIGLCKLVLRKLVKDFTYERVKMLIKKPIKNMNSLVERPLNTLCIKYDINVILKALEDINEEMKVKEENKDIQ